MMRIMARLQKAQITDTLVKYDTPGQTGNFDKSKYAMAGFQNYEAMVVGGSGGRAGAWVGTVAGHAYYLQGAGGGGGGASRRKAKLSELPVLCAFSVGVRGVDNPGGGTTGLHYNGDNGTTSSFADVLYGISGTGGEGAPVNGSGAWNPAKGGVGGSGYDISSVGGSYGSGGTQPATFPNRPAPSDGESNTTVTGAISSTSMGGGGGGMGDQRTDYQGVYQAAQNGAVGAATGDYASAGTAKVASAYFTDSFGGGGGGAQIGPVSGEIDSSTVQATYGRAGGDPKFGKGCVVIKIS